jgi:hypothetical protein
MSIVGIASLYFGLCVSKAAAQASPPTILIINVENLVEYIQDTFDSPAVAANTAAKPAEFDRNFDVATVLGDIAMVNRRPARGTYIGRTRVIRSTPNPKPGEAIADVPRAAIREVVIEILKADGTPVGRIMGLGMSGGPPPPGAPLAQTGGNWAIVGGTGAFLGARGEFGGAQQRGSPIGRAASMAEDPARRRENGGGPQPIALMVIPMSTPEVASILGSPAIMHAHNSSLVTAAMPAAAGEVLSIHATGLGPTVPGIDPGQPFPPAPASLVNSPIELTLNDLPAEILSAVGVPGAIDIYEIRFRLPGDAPKGPAKVN